MVYLIALSETAANDGRDGLDDDWDGLNHDRDDLDDDWDSLNHDRDDLDDDWDSLDHDRDDLDDDWDSLDHDRDDLDDDWDGSNKADRKDICLVKNLLCSDHRAFTRPAHLMQQ